MIMLFIFLHIYFVYVDFVSLKKKKEENPESSHSDQGQLSLYFHLVSFLEETVFGHLHL